MTTPELLYINSFFTDFSHDQVVTLTEAADKIRVSQVTPSVKDAITRMTDGQLGTLLVLEAGKLFGIVLEGDSFRKVILTGKSFDDAAIREIITRNTIEASPDQTVEKCLAITQKNHVRHLPIVVDGFMIGTISMEDLARIILLEKEGQ